MQNHGIFRTRSIFRTLAHTELEAYSEHCQASTIKCFAKIATWRTFKPKLEKQKKLLCFFIIRKMKLSSSNIKKIIIFSQKKAFLIFQETETPKKFFIFQEKELSYISGNFLYLGSNFPSSKKKQKPHS